MSWVNCPSFFAININSYINQLYNGYENSTVDNDSDIHKRQIKIIGYDYTTTTKH